MIDCGMIPGVCPSPENENPPAPIAAISFCSWAGDESTWDSAAWMRESFCGEGEGGVVVRAVNAGAETE
jgi:hypothetical protein